MRIYIMTIVLFLSACLPNVHARELDLDWLAGAWCSSSDDVRGEEHWMRNDGGLMLGMSRTITRRGTEYEFVRIEISANSARYIAQPSTQSETAFELSEQDAFSATFINPSHDFPKRIRYWRQGERLFARIDGGADSPRFRGFEWTRCVVH